MDQDIALMELAQLREIRQWIDRHRVHVTRELAACEQDSIGSAFIDQLLGVATRRGRERDGENAFSEDLGDRQDASEFGEERSLARVTAIGVRTDVRLANRTICDLCRVRVAVWELHLRTVPFQPRR